MVLASQLSSRVPTNFSLIFVFSFLTNQPTSGSPSAALLAKSVRASAAVPAGPPPLRIGSSVTPSL